LHFGFVQGREDILLDFEGEKARGLIFLSGNYQSVLIVLSLLLLTAIIRMIPQPTQNPAIVGKMSKPPSTNFDSLAGIGDSPYRKKAPIKNA
jgi:hypothetical protein